MYLYTKYSITNTPNNQTAAYNTWTYQTDYRYQHVPTSFIDAAGNRVQWTQWNPPPMVAVPGGAWSGTSTRTGSYYAQNVVPSGGAIFY